MLAAELRGPGDPKLLYPAELEQVRRAVPKRVQEFAAGRLCARRVLAEFKVFDFPVRMAEDRQPVWPDNLTGSITHTSGFCAAVVAERRCLRALGLDTEVVGGIKAEIWRMLCVPDELAWIRSLPEPQQSAAVTLVFSAKEAFYKCQYPLTREQLDFHDVRVEAAWDERTWGEAAGSFKIDAQRHGALGVQAELPMQGRFLFHQEFVSAGIALRAG